MPGRIGFEVNLGGARNSAATRARSDTFRILVMGDFSGRRNRGLEAVADLALRPTLSIDIDKFDAVFARLAPGLALGARSGGNNGIELQFASIDDFHPDQLFAALEPFRQLRESRARLLSPASFEQEAARLMANQPSEPAVVELASGAVTSDEQNALPQQTTTQSAATHQPAEDQSTLLQRLMGGAPAGTAAHAMSSAQAVTSQSVVDGLIRKLVQPLIKPGATQSAAPYVAALDASSAELMRTVVHDPDFQSLEATWRGVRRLVDSLSLGDELELQIVDVSKDELLADLEAAQGNPQDSAAYRLLAQGGRRGADAQPWSLLIGHYTFGANADDIALLTHLGVIASHAGAPLLAAADSSLAGCDGLDERTEPRAWAFKDAEAEKCWSALRHSPVARWLGLALPRVLLRLPYGAKTDPVECFAFEESATTSDHSAYLWGSPALACAQVIGDRLLVAGPDASIAGPHDIDDLPAHIRDQDGERRLQACAEFLLPLHAGEEMQRRGLIPVLSYGNRNAARVLGIQSIAEPLGALAGFD
jgi:type VI secretion system protein ImpC